MPYHKQDDAFYEEGEPCEHIGCLKHISHPCEGCGRIAGKVVKSCNNCFNRDPWANKNCNLDNPMMCLVGLGPFPPADGYAYNNWLPLNKKAEQDAFKVAAKAQKKMNDAGISCETCFYRGKYPYTKCSIDARACLGNGLPSKYNSWVQRGENGDCYEDYFKAGGEAMRDQMDADILSEVCEAARVEDISIKEILCDLAGKFCVYWTGFSILVLIAIGFANFISWMVS